jgi:hypothetical protein
MRIDQKLIHPSEWKVISEECVSCDLHEIICGGEMNWLLLCLYLTLISTSCVVEQSCAKVNGKTPASRNSEAQGTCEVRLSAAVAKSRT